MLRLAAASVLGAGAAASGSLTIEVQLPGGGKNATVSASGQQVSMEVYAVVTGQNGTGADDGVQIADGSFLSTGALLGNLSASLVAPFNAPGSSAGAVQDLDGDGDLDIGSNFATDGSNFWAARASQPQSPNGYPAQSIPPSTYGFVDGASYIVQMGTLTFTVTGSSATSTVVNFRPRQSSNSAALWFEEVLSPSKTASNGVFQEGALGVTVTLKPEWAVDTDGNWSGGSNWSASIPDGVGVGAQFLSAISASREVTVDSPRTLGSVTFDNPNRYVLRGSATVTLDTAGGPARIDVLAGSHTIESPVDLAVDTDVEVGAASTLTVSGALSAASGVTLSKQGTGTLEVSHLRMDTVDIIAGGVTVLPDGTDQGVSVIKNLLLTPGTMLDLNDNDLVVDYTGASPFNDLQDMVLAGYSATVDPSKAGIVSSTSQAQGGDTILALVDNAAVGGFFTNWLGHSVDFDTVIGKYTYFGDANLDGQVTGDDFALAVSNLGMTGALWTDGDVNFDGAVTGDDLSIIIANLGKGVGNPLGSAIPEPTGVGVLALCVMGLRRRRSTGKPDSGRK